MAGHMHMPAAQHGMESQQPMQDLLHTPGGSHGRGSRGHSPQFQQTTSEKHWSPPTETKTNLPVGAPPTLVAPPPHPSKADITTHLQDSQVESWEDIDDAGPAPQPPSEVPSSQRENPASSTPPTTASELKTDSVSNSSSGRSTPKSQEQPPVKEAPSSSSSTSSSSTPDLAKAERKQPSPSLTERGTGGVSRAESGPGKGSKHSQAAPPKDEHEKENINIVFIGHVDAGKSTIGGHVLYLTGQVDKRTLEKYEREAKEKNRETWYLAWALDTNQEERNKGKTVECGRASFETDKKRFTILDAPGHAGFVPNMISGAAQADIGVLVISARKGEFETGFERRGQTREHAMLAKTAGVKHLVILINKMDDPTVFWDENRYEECKIKLTPFLKKVGFNPKTDLAFIPVSGLTGANIKEVAPEEVCPWYRGPAFISYLDELPPLTREDTGPFRMPISDKYKDMGTMVMGKVESGGLAKGMTLTLMPNKAVVEVISILSNEEEVNTAYSGDNIRVKLKGVEEEDISAGFVLCDTDSLCHVGSTFDAQIAILEHKSIICAGYSAVLHIHSVVEEVQIKQLLALIDKKTGKKVAQRPRFVKQDQVVIARLQTAGIICLETFKEFPQMARFTLRDEGKTIAIGKVLKLIE
ncbi:Eukaryotic peptide chain release factor GTP-binding subunit ERF3A [Geodia barretti]|uniref:Eukaryotic peptide chain release factor GTP-binding subunit ERF3A n=2 Tax=Geodia barretti TaxID=519541 RepID=A0AA35RV22_GEOBA|nr:Eukaryotic peptide chain release factor GTP-binding subunit ERF3A [Geodia barretti]